MADWNLLRSALNEAGDSVRYTWDELEVLVGGLPASATNHRAWWSGDRPHVNAWRGAGFTVTSLVPGREVTFRRAGTSTTATSTATPVSTEGDNLAAERQPPTLLLVACVKEKLAIPAAARDLYVSPLFKKEREYAERLDLPWFILSAEHGLVVPDEWLSPYERYLPDTPPSFRRAWGTWVVERLELLTGSLKRRTIEVHAGATYVDALRDPLASKGASVYEPLAGLKMGQRLAWYGARPDTTDEPITPGADLHKAAEDFCERLTDHSSAITPGEFITRGPSDLRVPGLYSWWVDVAGAVDLSTGLGLYLHPGLIYAGLAGATRWPSGRPSTNTLWSRISEMHLGGRHEFSTFRRTLGAILANARHEQEIDEARLTKWMQDHLKLIAAPFEDADTLGQLEGDVLSRLDPPLNLQGMPATATRRRLKELRRPHARGRVKPGTAGGDQL